MVAVESPPNSTPGSHQIVTKRAFLHAVNETAKWLPGSFICCFSAVLSSHRGVTVSRNSDWLPLQRLVFPCSDWRSKLAHFTAHRSAAWVLSEAWQSQIIGLDTSLNFQKGFRPCVSVMIETTIRSLSLTHTHWHRGLEHFWRFCTLPQFEHNYYKCTFELLLFNVHLDIKWNEFKKRILRLKREREF